MQRRVLQAHVGVVVEDPGLDPAGLTWCDGADVELLPRLGHCVPQVVPSGPVEDVDLETGNGRPPGSADHYRDALDLVAIAPVVLEVVDRVADQVRDRVYRLGALDLHRVDVWERHLNVEPGGGGDPQGVQAGVGIGQLHPPAVLIDV